MSLNSANFKLVLGPILVAIVVAMGLRPLEASIKANSSAVRVSGEQLERLVGNGGMLGVLGGLRSVVASGFWLRANQAWEREDVAATTALIELTVAADERPLYFWLNGARMLAYDMPVWRTHRVMPAGVRRNIEVEQANRALAFLNQGLRWHGGEADLYVEMANIYLRRLDDQENAARYYRLAAEQPRAPYYAARIYGELLIALGRNEEALHWLRAVEETLPSDDPAARSQIVRARVLALEQRISLSPTEN
jgi:tetratricopeptide (TPR) repeat protein